FHLFEVVSLSGSGLSEVSSASYTKTTDSSSSSSLHVPGLQALLAGTPSADNPAPASHRNPGASLLERLSAAQQQSSIKSNAAVTVGSSSSSSSSISTTSISAAIPTHQSSVLGGGSSAAAAVLRSDSGSGGPPPNINIASLNLPGLNVAGLQSLTANLGPGLQNVQVSIPGLAVPFSLSVNVPVSSTPVILSSPPPS
ncbi:unnamed protein product, partial [Meganyctiphanes norvegica]